MRLHGRLLAYLSILIIAVFAGCGDDDNSGVIPIYNASVTVDSTDTYTYHQSEMSAAYNILAVNSPLITAGSTVLRVQDNTTMHSGLLLTFKGFTTGTYSVADAMATMSFTDITNTTYRAAESLNYAPTALVTSGSVTVTEYGIVGANIIGTFSFVASVLEDKAPTINTVTVTGGFTVQRLANDSLY